MPLFKGISLFLNQLLWRHWRPWLLSKLFWWPLTSCRLGLNQLIWLCVSWWFLLAHISLTLWSCPSPRLSSSVVTRAHQLKSKDKWERHIQKEISGRDTISPPRYASWGVCTEKASKSLGTPYPLQAKMAVGSQGIISDVSRVEPKPLPGYL